MKLSTLMVELVGTFALVFTIAISSGNPLAIGATLAVLVASFGPVSGGHFNGAVTLGHFFSQRLSGRQTVLYLIAQVIGAALASLLFYLMAKVAFVPQGSAGLDLWAVMALEAIFTALLVSVVLRVASTEKAVYGSIAPLVIGLALLGGVYVTGQVTGGVLNPSLGLGALLMDLKTQTADMMKLSNYVAMYLLSPIVGGALAAGFDRYLRRQS